VAFSAVSPLRGMARPRDEAATWEISTAGKLAMDEFAFQRMHRRPVPAVRPFASTCGPEPFATTNSTMYSMSHHKEPPHVAVPSFTMGRKNDLGTSSNYRQINLDQLRIGQLHLGDQARTWETTSGATHAKPHQEHPLQGHGAPRSGLAPRMPFSEIDRRFGQLDSTGAMPGTYGERSLRSEAMTSYKNPGRQPREPPTLTLGTTNDIGSTTKYSKTPAILAGMTHYSLGNTERNYSTTAMESTKAPPPLHERLGKEPAGRQPGVGPSEVEQRFMKNVNSQDYNIINGGTRLLGNRNTEALKAQAASEAFTRPVGRKQHPNVNPADRGVTGVRQSFDIITGADRPRERW